MKIHGRGFYLHKNDKKWLMDNYPSVICFANATSPDKGRQEGV